MDYQFAELLRQHTDLTPEEVHAALTCLGA